MNYLHWIAGSILALVWFSRLLGAALGVPKITDVLLPEWNRKPAGSSPRVSIIVPARNEAEHVEQTLTQLLRLEYDNYEIIAVNDRSTDGTGQVMDRVASAASAPERLRVIHVSQLPPNWLGKAHAMWTGAKQASGEWLLFTDADVLFRPDALTRTTAYAAAERADHVVLFPDFVMHGPGERMMIAFFQTLFLFGHRPWRVADPQTKDFMGVGAFNMIRRPVYEAIGTYEALRFEVLDDMKLGKVVKTAGYAQRNVFGRGLLSIHWAKGAMGVVENLTKNMFAVLSFQWWRALGSAFALVFLNLLPFAGVALAHGWARVPYAVALASMFGIYVGMSRMSDIPAYYIILHPVSSALFVYIMFRSMVLTLGRGGVVWRGTFYRLEDLRKGMV
jgi:glycosyltransferase involved in cell wall biosynthesis